MSEVEKMYENAGIKKEVIPCPAKYYGYDCTRNNWDDEDCSCDIEGYSPFTAEKQIYLIKFLSDKAEYLGIHYDRYKGLFEMQTDVGGLSIKNEFEEALASRVNVLWQDLTDAERTQIKEILE